MIESKYLEFDKVGDTGATEIWNVLSTSSGFILGKIKWFGRWRQYCFWPSPDCVFNKECLSDIQKMIQELMEDRAKAKRAKVKRFQQRIKNRTKKQ